MTAFAQSPQCDPNDPHCHICGDVATVGRVVSVDDASRTATVDFATGTATVALDLVDVSAGDYVLVHLGFAIEQVSAI